MRSQWTNSIIWYENRGTHFFYIIDFLKVNCFTRVAQLGDSISCQKSQVSHIHDKETAKIHVGHILSLRD